MELCVLQYFLAVVQEENVSRAAEALHITQPTLSRQMAQLEDELGTPLFIRGKHLVLTDAGIKLRRRAEEVVALMDKIENEFNNDGELGGIISIGSGGLNASQVMIAAMEGFRKRYPKVQFQLYTNSAPYIKEQLEQGLLDFGLLLEPVDITKFDYMRMKKKEKWGLLLRAGHPLAGKEYITKDDIADEPLIMTDRKSVQKEIENWLESPLSTLDIFATYNIITNAATMVDSGVASGLGVIAGARSVVNGIKICLEIRCCMIIFSINKIDNI